MAMSSQLNVAKVFMVLCPLFAVSCVSVEFDRMTGTTFPTSQVVNSQTVDVQSIYKDAGFAVSVNEDDTNIAQLNIPQNECITDAELDSLENSHRSSPLFPSMGTHYLYGIVVNHFGEVLDTCVENWVLGKMWDHHTRSAFAIFYKHSSIQAGTPEYLRTTVHEIGHALNLHHQDGDGSTTIMNKTGDINDNWVFEFSDDSKEHLQDHPTKCKFPGAVGGAPFTWVAPEHFAWHSSSGFTSFNCN